MILAFLLLLLPKGENQAYNKLLAALGRTWQIQTRRTGDVSTVFIY